MSFKAPKLRAPKISQLLGNTPKPIPEKPKPPVEEPKPEQLKVESEPKPTEKSPEQPKPEPPVKESEPKIETPEVSAIDKLDLQTSKITPVIRNLAHQLSAEGVVADPGAVMRLYREGLLEVFSHICISQSATTILPPHITNMAIFVKVQLTGRDLERAQKLSKDPWHF